MVVSSGRSKRYSSPRGRFLAVLLSLLLEREIDALREAAAGGDGRRWGEKVRMMSETEEQRMGILFVFLLIFIFLGIFEIFIF